MRPIQPVGKSVEILCYMPQRIAMTETPLLEMGVMQLEMLRQLIFVQEDLQLVLLTLVQPVLEEPLLMQLTLPVLFSVEILFCMQQKIEMMVIPLQEMVEMQHEM